MIFVKILPDREFIFFSFGNIKDPRSDCNHKSQPIPEIFKTVVNVSVIPKPVGCCPWGLSTWWPPACKYDIPPASTDSIFAIHNVQLAIKDTNLPNINISHLKNCTKIPDDIDTQCRQPKIFHFDFLGKAQKCHFQDALDENQYFLDGGRKIFYFSCSNGEKL
jgi:hypothetical protein